MKNITHWFWSDVGFFKQWVEKYISVIVKVIENKVYSVTSKDIKMLNKFDFYISIAFVSVAKQRDKYSYIKSTTFFLLMNMLLIVCGM